MLGVTAHLPEEVSQVLETGSPVEWGTVTEHKQWGGASGGCAMF